MRRFCALLLGLVAVVALAPLSGCGYSSAGLYPTEVQTIALPLFDNQSFERGIEADFGEALVKEVVTRTPYRVVDGSAAQSTLSGTIRRAARRRVSLTDLGGVPEEVEYGITIDFVWADAAGRTVYASATGLEQVGSHVPAPGLAEPESVAIQNAIERLAEDVVDLMRSDW